MGAAQPPDRASASRRHAPTRAPSGGGSIAEARPDVARPSTAEAGRRRGDPGAARDRPLLPGAGILAIGLVGLTLGLAATAVVLDRGWDPGAVVIGPWVTRPGVGTPAIDPYTAAALARSGAMPLAANEGLSFTAATDDTGYRLIGTCGYRIGGVMPPARYWTLAVTGGSGRITEDPARRSALASTSVIRDTSGAFSIAIGPEARPGNWLPVADTGPLTLTLRLYGTPSAGGVGEIATAHLPSIDRQSCSPSDAAPPSRVVAADRKTR